MSTVKAQPLTISSSGFQALRLRWNLARWAPIPLRLIVGYGFFAHGIAKLEKGPELFVEILQAIGTPSPHFMAWLTILVELFGGLAVLLGAFVPWASAPMIAVLLVAIFTVHLPFGFTSIKLIAVTADGPKFGPPVMLVSSAHRPNQHAQTLVSRNQRPRISEYLRMGRF